MQFGVIIVNVDHRLPFSKKVYHFYCQWHVVKVVRRQYSSLSVASGLTSVFLVIIGIIRMWFVF